MSSNSTADDNCRAIYRKKDLRQPVSRYVQKCHEIIYYSHECNRVTLVASLPAIRLSRRNPIPFSVPPFLCSRYTTHFIHVRSKLQTLSFNFLTYRIIISGYEKVSRSTKLFAIYGRTLSRFARCFTANSRLPLTIVRAILSRTETCE